MLTNRLVEWPGRCPLFSLGWIHCWLLVGFGASIHSQLLFVIVVRLPVHEPGSDVDRADYAVVHTDEVGSPQIWSDGHTVHAEDAH